MACLKLAFSFTMYSLKYFSAASPYVVPVMGEELFAQPIILVVMMFFHNNMHLAHIVFAPIWFIHRVGSYICMLFFCNVF